MYQCYECGINLCSISYRNRHIKTKKHQKNATKVEVMSVNECMVYKTENIPLPVIVFTEQKQATEEQKHIKQITEEQKQYSPTTEEQKNIDQTLTEIEKQILESPYVKSGIFTKSLTNYRYEDLAENMEQYIYAMTMSSYNDTLTRIKKRITSLRKKYNNPKCKISKETIMENMLLEEKEFNKIKTQRRNYYEKNMLIDAFFEKKRREHNNNQKIEAMKKRKETMELFQTAVNNAERVDGNRLVHFNGIVFCYPDKECNEPTTEGRSNESS